MNTVMCSALNDQLDGRNERVYIGKSPWIRELLLIFNKWFLKKTTTRSAKENNDGLTEKVITGMFGAPDEESVCCIDFTDVQKKKFKLKNLFSIAINGSSQFYYWWSAIVSLACLYNYIMIVIMIFEDVYKYFYFNWICANLATDFIFLLDIFVQARKAFRQDGIEIKHFSDTALHYLTSWIFYVDLFAVIPFDLILLLNDELVIVRCNRLLKIYRVWNFIGLTENRITFPNLFHILKLAATCFIIFHWNGCFYHGLSIFYDFNVATIDDWIFSYDKIPDPVFAKKVSWIAPKVTAYNENNRDARHREKYVFELSLFWFNRTEAVHFSNFTKQYGLSFYWSALTLVTLGEQPSPTFSLQCLFEIIDTLCGLVIFAVIIGDIGNMVTNMNATKTNFEEVLDGCKQYMMYRKVPLGLQERVISWFGYVWDSGQAKVDETAYEEFLPPRLYGQLLVNIHMETLRRAKLFQECESGVLFEIVLMLELQVFSPGDYVCKKGDVGKEMYIVRKGQLEVVSDDGTKVFVVLNEGSVFGDLSILDIPGNKNGNKRTAAVRSVGFSDLYVLNKESLWDILKEYPEAKKSLLERGKELLRKDGLLNEKEEEEEMMFVQGHTTLEENLFYMQEITDKLGDTINMLFSDFVEMTNEMKNRLSKLENIVNRIEARRTSIFQ